MAPLVSVLQSELDADPSARLWALVFYLADHPEAQRDKRCRSFWLAYLYDAEVKNGGHLQYFHNQGSTLVGETLAALRIIGADNHAQLLERCAEQVANNPIIPVTSLSEYPALAAARSFSAEDATYYEQPQDVLSLLEAHFEETLHECVVVRGA